MGELVMSKPHPQSPETSQRRPVAVERLDSWKEIARYLNRDIRTVQRWEEAGGLPVRRLARARLKGSPVYAYTSELDAWLLKNPPSNLEKELEPGSLAQAGWKTRRVFWAAVSLIVLVAGAAVTWRLLRRQPSVPPLRVVSLTSYPGQEHYPAISPDGRQVAFAWNGAKQDNFDLYVKFLDGGEPLRLTTHPGRDGWPAWSPDGRLIVFGRWVLGAANVEVLIVPALGGAERKILEFPLPLQPASFWPAGCWTPDGKWLAVNIPTDKNKPAALGLVSVQTQEVRPLAEPVAGSAGDCCPAITQDGRRLAFLRASAGRIWNIYIQSLGSDYRPMGEPRQLTVEPSGALNPMWTADGREVLYITNREGERTLWRVPHDRSRAASPLESMGPIGFFWAISPRGDRLVYSDNRSDPDIWRVDLAGDKSVSRVVSSSAWDRNPEIAPDGEREPLSDGIWKVAAGGGEESRVGSFRISGHSNNFAVGREGIYYASSADPERWFELWFCRFSTGKSERISRIDKRLWAGMSVSPSGRWLLFTAMEAKSGDLYMVENFR